MGRPPVEGTLDLGSLYSLRIGTPRLTLRLGTVEELRALGRLAELGIHPADEMPFAVAWTDGMGTPGFVDDVVTYHRSQLEAWSTDSWTLNLLVWERAVRAAGNAGFARRDGRLVGSQGISGELFVDRRTVSTGSWLGVAFQGRGLGTEMRAAVLELAFAGLGARQAESAWLEGNHASRRVSEKLGYRESGLKEEAPRGTPVVAHEVVVNRAAWHAPVAVCLQGLQECLPCFGLSGDGAEPL
jgi:RimJ/RimL family protein N-acetyltransferase